MNLLRSNAIIWCVRWPAGVAALSVLVALRVVRVWLLLRHCWLLGALQLRVASHVLIIFELLLLVLQAQLQVHRPVVGAALPRARDLAGAFALRLVSLRADIIIVDNVNLVLQLGVNNA